MDSQRITQLAGTAVPLRGDDIDTDRIMPARYLKTVTYENLEHHLFEDDRAAATRAGTLHILDEPQYTGASILLVNTNFGCGSSREHAPQGLKQAGFHLLIGESFSDIFFGNAVMIGLPCVSVSHEDAQALMAKVEGSPGTRIVVDLEAGTCGAAGFQCPVSLPRQIRDAFINGTWDTTGLLMADYGEVEAVAARLPYVGW